MNNKYQITGIHCTSCKYYIEETLQKVDGVNSVQVNVTDNSAYIDFDSSKTTISSLNNRISDAGYRIDQGGNGSNYIDEAKDLIPVNLTIGLVFVALSFVMMLLDIFMSAGIFESPGYVIEFFHHLMPIMATYMLVSLGGNYLKAIPSFVKTGHANMNTLVGIGVAVAFLYSFLVTAFESSLGEFLGTGNYYDVVIVLIGLIGLGQYWEAKAKRKTLEAVRMLVESGVKTVLLKKNDIVENVDLEIVRVGDTLVVKQGMKIPVDGKIIIGSGSLNESSMTGESRLVSKTIGETVYASTTLENGYIELEAMAIGENSKLGQITKLVESAMNSKAEVQELVDKIAARFVPAIMIIAILSFFLWIGIGFFTGHSSEYLRLGIVSLVSVLIVACPCSLGLATPLAIAVGVSEGAKRGILFKSADSLQNIRNATVLIFDKTGTITDGRMRILNIYKSGSTSMNDSEILQIAASIESKTTHPIAQAFLEDNKLPIIDVSDFQNFGGKGISGIINSEEYRLGNASFVSSADIAFPKTSNNTIIYLSRGGEALAAFELADRLKDGTSQILKSLRNRKLQLILATGDRKDVGLEVGMAAGFLENEIYAELLPEDKLAIIKDFQSRGHVVAMIGDGVNDSPALAQSDIGVAMGNGTDIAIETADVTILGGDLSKLEIIMNISQRTFRKIKENLFWAFGYNLILIPLAAGLLYPIWHIVLSPIIAGIAMSLSSLSVTINSLRIKRK